MQVKEIKQEGLSHELEVTITAKDIDKRIDIKLADMSKTIRLPGFRPGKVPMPILKKRYGKNLMGEVLESAVNETSAKVMEDKGLTPAMQPKIEVKEFDDGKDLVYAMTVEVLPEFKVADYKKMKLTKLVSEIDDKSVDEALERIAGSRKQSQPIEKARKTKNGDIVDMNFAGRTADDNVEHDGMQASGHQLELGSGQFIPGFEEQLIGKNAGDKVEVKVSFPEEYHADDLAGREAIFDVEINEIREVVEAKIDDEFAKSLGMDDLEALKNAVREQVGGEYESHSRLKLKKEILDQLDDKHDFEIPAGMLEMEYQQIVRQMEAEAQAQGEKDAELSAEEKEDLDKIAQRRVRLGLVLSEIGKENNITVADADLQRAVISEAQKYPGQEKQVFDYFSQNRQALESLRAPIFEDKVVDLIVEHAEITEKKVSFEELTAPIEAEESDKPKKKAAAKKKAPAKKAEAKKSDDKPAAKKKAPAKKKAAAKK